MDLHSGDPYWLIKNGYGQNYPNLNKNISCDVAVIGGGITGSLIAYYLHKAGASVAVAERRHVGFGSTCASTALLQYEIDTHLADLRKIAGKKNADASYLFCVEAIDGIRKIAEKISTDCQFKLKKSLYIASRESHVVKLEKELEARQEIGIKVKLLGKSEIKKITGLSAPAALYSNIAAQMDPYLFTQGLFDHLSGKGVKVFDLTEVKAIREDASGAKLICTNGSVISCKKFVFANGYESQTDLKKKYIQLNSTYVVISKPLKKIYIDSLKPLIWESARPYLYIRTAGNRIIVGGKDEPYYDPEARDALIASKSQALRKAFIKRLPAIPFEIDFSWAGTFANTKDGLPYIGPNDRYRHAHYALGFGGNGIIFSQVAGALISEAIAEGKAPHPAFAFDRKMA